MSLIDQSKVPLHTKSTYPAPHDRQMAGRAVQALGDAGGLTQFGANLVILAPGAKSSLRHWHVHEDEFVMVTQGALMLVQDGGETLMQTGDCAAFPAGRANGHQLINRSSAEARFLVIGTRAKKETVFYSDLDMKVEITPGSHRFTRQDGSALEQDA
jgi:uncharacterized cupin superfamily protein